MQHEAMMEMLKSLKLHGMAHALGDLAAQDSPAYQSAVAILSRLLKAETTEREVRSLAYQMKVARFPAYRDLTGFDFSCSEANEALVRQLHRCEFLESAHNVVLVGGPGTGKTHLGTAIARPSNWSTHWNWRRSLASPAIWPSASGNGPVSLGMPR